MGEALEILAYFVGVAAIIFAFAYLIKVLREPTIVVKTDRELPPLPSLEQRMSRYGFQRETPQWSYKETTKYFPSGTDDIKTRPPKPEHTPHPKEKN